MAGYRHFSQVRIGFAMPPSLLERLEGYCKQNSASMTEVCRLALVAFLDSAEA